MKTDDRTYLKIKMKSLMAEARIIRFEERKTCGMEKWKLQYHRRTTVRAAARRTQFAYALIRGKSIDTVAAGYQLSKHTSIHQWANDVAEIAKMIRTYGKPEHNKDSQKIVEAWMRDSVDKEKSTKMEQTLSASLS